MLPRPIWPGGGFGGWGTGLRTQQAPHTWLGGANALRSFPTPLVLEDPSLLPLLFSPVLPSMPPGPTQAGGVLWGHRTGPESRADFPGQLGRGDAGSVPPNLSPWGSLQAWEPLPPLSHPSEALVLSGLHFSSLLSAPTSYQFAWGFFLSLWASGSPTSIRQAP